MDMLDTSAMLRSFLLHGRYHYGCITGLPETLRTRRDWTNAKGRRKPRFVFVLGQICALPNSKHIAGETGSMAGHATRGKRLMAVQYRG
ncbi:hypothetical protein OIDMADRAFT_16440 [Oidiodendron maius Zn]|uniref:Uncharacterized protein n=1 Tax=Oidiodendron maius (strain Zn) TaxID=913774 RepID=A0A0C3HYT0_OIDMZ|nr:hypothetical protein OIDMADRAFT_16440 [Oidiodendron maius Zn]